jgi:CubicO group peptidase (beta-lactamase class C family)
MRFSFAVVVTCMSVAALVWAAVVLGVVFAASAADLPRAAPEDLGFSSQRLERLDSFYENEVKKGDIAGVVVLVARHGKIAHLSAIGYADIEKKRKMQTDTIFRLYSMTKPIASTALMMLYEEGRFQLQDPISQYLPEFASLRVLRNPDGDLTDTVPLQRPPTIQDILRHTGGFGTGASADAFDTQYRNTHMFDPDVSLAESMTILSRLPLRYQPGTKWVYSVGPDIAARLVDQPWQASSAQTALISGRVLPTRSFGSTRRRTWWSWQCCRPWGFRPLKTFGRKSGRSCTAR